MKQLCSYYFKIIIVWVVNSQEKKSDKWAQKIVGWFFVIFITEFNPIILEAFVEERKVSFLLMVMYPEECLYEL